MLPIFIMLAVAGICIGLYMIFTNSVPKIASKPQVENNEVVVSQEESENSVVLLQNELPRIESSELTQGIVTEIVRDFTQNSEITDSDISSSVTDEGFNKLLNDEVDVLISTYPSDDILELANTRGIELDIIPIATDGFVFFVSCDNPVNGLKVSDIQKIYNGQVNNWSQIGGDNQIIKAFQRPNNSPSQIEMITSVMKNLQMIDAPKDVFHDKNFGEIDDLIALYDNSANAIGYSYYYYATTMYGNDNMKFFKVNGVAPNHDTIQNESYPIITSYYIVTLKGNNDEATNKLKEALLSKRGQKIAREAGYIELDK